VLAGFKRIGGSAKKKNFHGRGGEGEGEGGEVRYVVFCKSQRLLEVNLYVFYLSRRLPGGRMFNGACRR